MNMPVDRTTRSSTRSSARTRSTRSRPTSGPRSTSTSRKTPRARAEVDELRETAASLALAPVDRRPPRRRSSGTASPPTIDDERERPPTSSRRAEPARRRGRGVWIASAVAAAAAIAVIVLALQVVSLNNDLDKERRPTATRIAAAVSTAPRRPTAPAPRRSPRIAGRRARRAAPRRHRLPRQRRSRRRSPARRRTSCGRSPAPARNRRSCRPACSDPTPLRASFKLAGPVQSFAITVEARRAVPPSPRRHRSPAATCPESSRAYAGAVPFGVYVHIPFCARRCDYCDFATWTDRAHLIDDYVDACVTDLDAPAASGHPAGDERLLRRRHAVAAPGRRSSRASSTRSTATADAEVTVECNPDSVDADEARRRTARAGVNRLSASACSRWRRTCSPRSVARTIPANVERAIALARDAGFDASTSTSSTARPARRLDDWQRTLDGALALGVEHVSAYALTVEPATPLGRRVAAGARPRPTTTTRPTTYVLADDGARRGRASSGTRSRTGRGPGEECRHNQLLLERRRVPRRSAARRTATPTAAAGGTCARPSATSPRSPRGDVAGGGLRDARRRDRAPRRRSRSRCAPAPGAAVAARRRGRGRRDLAAAGLAATGAGARVVLTRRGRLLASDLTARLLLAGGRPGRWHSVASTANEHPRRVAGTRYH